MTEAPLPTWPAPERNKGPLLEVLQKLFEGGLVVELGAGTGQHAVHFARGLPGVTWQPTEIDPELYRVIAARVQFSGLHNLKPPLLLDVRAPSWPVGECAGLFSANLLHVSAWAVSEQLFCGAARHLSEQGLLVTYGPYRLSGEHVSASNAAFDESLRAQDPSWGVRDVTELERCASRYGLALRERIQMPVNNLTLVWEKLGAGAARSARSP